MVITYQNKRPLSIVFKIFIFINSYKWYSYFMQVIEINKNRESYDKVPKEMNLIKRSWM